MIFGECPYCDNPVSTSIADQCPAMSKEICPSCNKTYWLLHSRISPEAYPLEAVEVNEENKTVRLLND